MLQGSACMVEDLARSSPLAEAWRAALPPATPVLAVRVIDDLRVLTLRHTGNGATAVQRVLAEHGLAALPHSGCCGGSDPWLVWAGPSECLLLTTHPALADAVLGALAPGRNSLACALDQSMGCLAFELCGPGMADVLSRLMDASAMPGQPGRAGRVRWMDISAVVMRTDAERALLLVDVAHGPYVAQWLAWAGQADPGINRAAGLPGP
jgi:sarcosine oxidase gamma subunit